MTRWIFFLVFVSFSFGAVAKKKTVGDLLNSIKSSRGKATRIGNKSKTNLPQSTDVFKKRKRKRVDFSKIEPPSSDKFVEQEGTDRAKLEAITDKAIQSLFNMSRRLEGDPNRGEVWLRLAENYMEKAGLVEYRINRRHERALRAFERRQGGQPPQLDMRPAHQYNKKAIQLYEWFIRDFPKDPKMDQALFFLGFNYVEVGQVKRGIQRYKRLTEQYPRSKYISESNFALGEYYFENNKWKSGYKHYSAVMRNRNARLNSFAQYKAGWCLFRMGRHKEAFDLMVGLIRSGKKQRQYEVAGMKRVSAFKIEQEALRDFVVFYAEAGKPAEAHSFFKQLAGSPQHMKHLEKLGYYYSDKGRRADARVVFNDLVRENPTAPKAFDYKYQVVLNYAYDSKARIFRRELYTWIKQFGPSSVWARANANNKELIQTANKLRELTLRNYVIQQHQTAQNSRAQYSQTLAKQGYQLYLVEFPNSENVPDMRFYYGELLYDLKSYVKAAEEYRWVATKSQSKYKKQAEINAVLAIEKTLPSEKSLVKAIGSSTAKRPISPMIQRFIDYGAWFRANNKEHEKRTEITFKMARLYYLHNHFDKAEPLFFEIVETAPRSKYTEYSANLLLDSYNLRKDYNGLDRTARKLLTYPAIAKSKLGREIREILENSNFRLAQNRETGDDYRGSADSFAKFAKENPNSKLAIKAMFNAGVNYERVGDYSKAIPFYQGILAKRVAPGEKRLKTQSRILLAQLYEKTGQYRKAAKQFEIAAVENKAKAADFYFNAAVIFAGLNEYGSGIKNYEKFLRSTKKKERIEAHYEIAQMNLRRGKLSVAKAGFRDYLKSRPPSAERAVESQYQIAEIERRLGQKKLYFTSYARVVAMQKQLRAGSKQALRLASRSALVLANENYNRFAAIRIPSSPKRQKKMIDTKIKRLKSFTSELAKIIAMDSPEGIIGALVLLGRANQNMYTAFKAVPAPKGLNKNELKKYQAGIDAVVAPYKKVAIESYQKAIGRSKEFHTYPSSLVDARKGLKVFAVPTVEVLLAHETLQLDWMGL